MSFRARGFAAPQEKLREARALLDFLANAVPSEGNPYGMLLSSEVNHLRPKQDWYLIHEYLEEYNEPEYFHQFMERAQRSGLQYLGEADYSTMLASNFPAQVQQKLEQLGGDIIETEQYMDLVRNRLFRQTILCRDSVKLDRSVAAERIDALYVASNSRPKEEAPLDLHSREPATFVRPGSTLTTKEPLVKAAMVYLRASWPRAISFPELLAAARGKLQPGVAIVDAERAAMEARGLALPLLRCYATTHVDLHAQPPRAAYDVAERPRAAKLARIQAKRGASATNLWHETVKLSDLERRVLGLLDGANSQEDILKALTAAAGAREIALQRHGQAVVDAGEIEQAFREALPAVLASIARKGLLWKGKS